MNDELIGAKISFIQNTYPGRNLSSKRTLLRISVLCKQTQSKQSYFLKLFIPYRLKESNALTISVLCILSL